MDNKLVGERLVKCREAHKIGQAKAADLAGINLSTLKKYEEGDFTQPSISPLVKLAELYQVSVDYILGRVDMEESTYKMDVEHLYEKCYEQYLRRLPLDQELEGEIREEAKRMVYSPGWPYNLIDAINRMNWIDYRFSEIEPIIPVPVSDEVKANLEWTIDYELSEREAVLIRMRFEEELTLDECADTFGVGRERIRQITNRALMKLRYPGLVKYILLGKDGAEMNKKVLKLRLEVSEKISEIRQLEETKRDLTKNGAESSYYELRDDLLDIPIIEMDLSVRSYNCCRRAGYNTVLDVRNAILDGSIEKVRNLGKRGLSEILQLFISVYGGFSLDEVDAFAQFVKDAYLMVAAPESYKEAK